MATDSIQKPTSIASSKTWNGRGKMGSALEKSLPFESLNPVAQLESWRKEIYRPVYHVHKWWANRLGSVFRAVVLAGALDEDADVWDQFYRRQDFDDLVVLDPFMGSGTTVGEALKLGCRAVGVDINPVSYFQVRKALEGCTEDGLRAGFRRLEKRVASKVKHYYQATYDGVDAEVLYTFWVKVLDCPDCGTASRLFSKWIFSSNAYPRRKPLSWALCPSCGEIDQISYFDTKATCGKCKTIFNPQDGPANRQHFACEGCGNQHRIVDVVRASASIPRHEMYALMLLLPDGRKVYKRAEVDDKRRYENASRALRRSKLSIPDDPIPPGFNTNQARGYNYRLWREMFNDRQLYSLGTLLSGILMEEDQEVREALLLLFSGSLEFNNMFCSFKGEGTGAVRHLFHHHILKPERTPLEANPWGTEKSSGAFSTLFERRLIAAKKYCSDPFEVRATTNNGKAKGEKVYGVSQPLNPTLAKTFAEIADGSARALIMQGDSSALPIPDESIDLVVTDPPYFDNVHYSELADFFYCWLKLALAGSDSAFQNGSTRSSDEIQCRDVDEFSRLLGGIFAECRRVLKEDGKLAFTFHHSRDEAWVAVVGAIESAGLEVVAAHPIKAEMSVAVPKKQSKEPIDLDLVIVCRKPTQKRRIRRSTVISKAVAEASALVGRYNAMGTHLSRGDIRVVLMGGFLKAHSQWLWHGGGTRNSAEELIDEFTAHIEELHSKQQVKDRRQQQGLFDSASA